MTDDVLGQVVLVTAGYDHAIKYWNVVEGVCMQSIQHNESHINRLAISNDKQRLAVAGNPCIRLYDNQHSSNNNMVSVAKGVSPSPDQQHQTTTPLAILEGHRSNVTAVGWNWEARWLWSASEDGTCRVWDARIGQHGVTVRCQREFVGKYPICDAALHPDQSELATVDERGVIRVWALAGKECLFEHVPQPHSPLPVPLQSVAYSPDGLLLACCNSQGSVYVYSHHQHIYKLLYSFPAHPTYITRLSFTPDGANIVTCSADGTCKLFSVPKDFTLERVLSGRQKWVWDCAFSADSAYILTASSDNNARLFERATGEVVSVFTGHAKAVTSIALNDIP
jgi:G protein beta subunit-like protein